VAIQTSVKFVFSSGVVGFEKPDPRIFDVACSRGIKTSELVRGGVTMAILKAYSIGFTGSSAANIIT
jgi:hypothetical protein